MANAIRAYGETRYKENVNLNKDLLKFSKYLKRFIASPQDFIDSNYASIGKYLRTNKSKIEMEGNFELSVSSRKGFALRGNANYINSLVGNSYGVYMNFENYPDSSDWYDPEGNGIDLSDDIIGKPKKLIKSILQDDNFIELTGIKVSANSKGGNDQFFVDAHEATLTSGGGSDAFWFADKYAGPSDRQMEIVITDFAPKKDKIYINKDDAFRTTVMHIGENTLVQIGDIANVVLKGAAIYSQDLDIEFVAKQPYSLPSLL